EPGALIRPSHRACQAWPTLCNQDRPLPSAVLARRLPPADPILMAGKSCRRKAPLERAPARPPGSPDTRLVTPASPHCPAASRICTPPPPQHASGLVTWAMGLHFHATADTMVSMRP